MKSDWISPKSAEESLAILRDIAKECQRIDPTDQFSELYQMIDEGRYLDVVEYDFRPHYRPDANVRSLILGRQAQALFSKCEFLDLGLDRRANALDRFLSSEKRCKETNQFLRATAGGHSRSLYPAVDAVFYLAQRKISSILGPVPDLSSLHMEFGPGANTNVKARLACPRAKLSASLECSHNLLPTVADLLEEVPHWALLHSCEEDDESFVVSVTCAPGRLQFVPKNATTDRSIVVEPLLNSFAQKGIGKFLRRCLLRAGVDLRDQSHNQKLAQLGSISDDIATVDLSMASDCISRELVYSLLPLDWAEFLDRFRTPSVTFEGESINLEKFSSMGNGFTFELESIIFYGLCSACCRQLHLSQKYVSVYGDDLIVPSAAAHLLERALTTAGFSFNKEKSFVSGPFRESCGADYFLGFDIRPYYNKTVISERTLYTMHNRFIRTGEYELANLVRRKCNPAIALYGPDGFGDGHLIGSFQLRRNRTLQRAGWCGGYFDTYSLKPIRYTGLLPGDAVLPTYSVYTRSGMDSPTEPDIVRGSRGYRKMSIYTLSESIFTAPSK